MVKTTLWRVLRRALGSRLLHFVVLGGALFVAAPKERDGRSVRIDAAQVTRAEQQEQARVGRALSPAEKQRIMHELVEDELLYREGRRLAVDESDPVVRARVAESMRRALRAAVPASAISDEDLTREATAIAQRAPERVRLDLWFVSKDRTDAVHVAEQLAREIRKSEGPGTPKSPDHPPITAGLLYTEEALSHVAGAEVARTAFAMRLGEGSEPVASTWGFYVIRLMDRRAMDASEARAEALQVLRARTATTDVARAVSRAARDYDVIVEVPPGDPAYDPAAVPGRPAGGAM